MNRKRIYISIPMHGKVGNGIDPARMMQQIVNSLNGIGVVPHDLAAYEHSGPCPPAYATANGHSAACWLRGDLIELLRCDGFVLGPGWEHSVGCRLELSVAAHCGIPIYYADLEEGHILNSTYHPIASF